ncbi:MAG: hypothetical protein HC769_34810 [Cyanobacteria bacterium CRU_2_1]|nr:hypothetical protein [Cyanobacteria bacterium RU_5_0]NJR63499.1 hypothetical protein [Cyanobacteria bacterium CRU_2_1]
MPIPFALTTNALLEIDHIFVCVKTAVSPSILADLGLNCAAQPIHRFNQGTVSNSIFFENMYLEMIWVEDAQASEIYAMQSGIDFLARSQQSQASPFGIALRQKLDQVARPFDLLPAENTVDRSQTFINFAAENLSAQTEPLCFVIPDSVSLLSLLDRTSLLHQRLISHPAGMQRLTAAKITLQRTGQLSDSLAMLRRDGIIEVEQDTLPHLELIFDDHKQSQHLDLRWLGIPVVLNY